MKLEVGWQGVADDGAITREWELAGDRPMGKREVEDMVEWGAEFCRTDHLSEASPYS